VSVVSIVGALSGLAQNIALLLSLTLLYGVIRPYSSKVPRRVQPVVTGLLFGLIATAAMHTPIVVAPGVIADARVIPVLLAGPFGGPVAALTAAALAAGYRAWLGGVGGAAGVGSILTTGLLGVAVAWCWRRRSPRLPALAFLLLGTALDAILLAWAVALPDRDLVVRVLSAAALPVGLFLPFGTLGLGMLLVYESRRHEERQRLALTQFAVERATEALFWIDAEGRIVNANAAAARLTGYARSELLATRVWEIEVGGSSERWRAFWAAAAQGRHHAEERRYRRRDGSEVPVDTSNDFVAYGGREWINVFARDVTERRRLEKERAEHLAREQALRVRAEEAGVLKDQFLTTLSHELRTPLTSVLGYARLLRQGTLPAAAAERALDVIERNALAQVQLVNDLLDVSSIMLGKLSMEWQPVSLTVLVEGEVDAVRAEADQAAIRLECHLPAALPPVAGDARRLQQIVRALLSNALKFTPPGGRVRVRLDRAGDAARLMIEDTGIGIAPAFLPHVFDRFRQADSSMTRAYGGLGLGLAIVRELVELHHGQVSAESPGDGAGATFTVLVPLQAARAPRSVFNSDPVAFRHSVDEQPRSLERPTGGGDP
jgi:PAS domain S-box-containing protein